MADTWGPIRADVYLDGELQASTADDFYGRQVTVLEGLKVSWGRDNAVDQPSPASLGLSFAQAAGQADFLQALTVGRTLDVTATGRIETGAVENVMAEGDFESLAVGSTPASIRSNVSALQVTTEQKHGGAHAARAQASTATPSWVIFPPAPFSADPTAWDAIPRGSKGETWSASAWVWCQHPVSLQAVAFTDPTGSSGTYVPTGPVVETLGGAGWLLLELPALVIGQSGRWIGLKLAFASLGTAWSGVPGTWAEQTGTWLDQNRGYVDDLSVEAPEGGTDRTVLVFQGRITDMSAKYVSALAGGTTQVDVTAKDFTADLANNRIGDVPWAVEALGDRVNRILALAGTGVTALVDDSIYQTQVTYRDVDSQPAAGLVEELAASVAGVAWSAVHDPGGAYYWLEDPRNRTALYYLHLDAGTDQVEVIPNPNAPESIKLTAHNVLEEPIRWDQDVADVATRVDVTWLEQGQDDKGKPTTTERHQVTVNGSLEKSLGQRGYSVSTQLVSAADAATVANALLAAQHPYQWRLSGITWAIHYEDALSREETVAALDLLDGSVRIGHSLSITELPAWVPISGAIVTFIEGGTYTFESGDWWLDLVASSSGQGASVTWATVDPTWTWTQFENLTWLDLIGVAGPPGTE
jgi:hypothetical protein